MNDSIPDPPPEDSESTSFGEKAKGLFHKHKGKIVTAIAAVGIVAVAVALTANRNEEQGTEHQDAEGEPSPGRENMGPPTRKPAAGHDVAAAVVKLPPGYNASEGRKEAYKEATGEDLLTGTTYRSKHRRCDSLEEETPGEAAA
nr:hypothetical protein KitaXyl93_23540 [Kitasatospora sp. Xyl93]